MAEEWDKAHDILDQIDCPGHRDRDSVYDRVNLAGDRLMLRPEGTICTLNLDKGQAKFLRHVLGKIGGSPEESRRKHADCIDDVIALAGVPDGGYADSYVSGQSLFFRDTNPEGEPDTADLVGRINEICDAAGITEGETVWRVEVLADQVRYLTHDKANLEAERAQLANKTTADDAAQKLADCDSLLCDFTSLLIRDGDAADEFLALARLAKRIRAALKNADA